MARNLAALRRLLLNWLANLSTSAKLFGIISIALMPLGVIALLASLQASATADTQRRADVRLATLEGARKLRTELSEDLAALSRAVDTLASEGQSVLTCTRLDLMLQAPSAQRPLFALFLADGQIACATPNFAPKLPSSRTFAVGPEVAFVDDGLEIVMRSPRGNGTAVLRYPAAVLLERIRPVSITLPSELAIYDNRHELALDSNMTRGARANESYSEPLGMFGLSLRLTVQRARLNSVELLLTFLPLLMWASASIIAFYMVDRLLIQPLALLRKSVSGFAPGAPIVLPPFRTPSREIRELAETFNQVGQTIAAHERSLARSLDDQVRLTREVHHRVKNNLQVVASLISLNARGAPAGPVANAYAAIQRRVDALAIVHRNHYAGIDVLEGIDAKALISELTANLRTGIAAHGPAPAIVSQIAAVRVSQDVAVPIAFLITELSEVSIEYDVASPITVSMTSASCETATLAVASLGFAAAIAGDGGFVARHARILDGLARQLRAPLEIDPISNRYSVTVPVLKAR